MKLFIILSICLICASATPINNDNNSNQDVSSSEKDLVNIINELDKEKSVYLIGGLSIEKTKQGRSIDSLPSDATFLDNVERYFNTHELQFNWPEEKEKNKIESGRAQSEEDDDDDDDEEGIEKFTSMTKTKSRTRKLRKLLLPLLVALKLKLAIVLPILALAIKAISIKGLIAGFLALLFSGATFFKEMVAPKKKDHITTAYITGHHPINAEIVHTDWHRSGQASAQELAYSGYNYHTIPATTY